MALGPDLNETLARARSDLRMGVPVVLEGAEGAVVCAAVETLGPDRLEALRALGAPDLVLTARRAGRASTARGATERAATAEERVEDVAQAGAENILG